MNNTFARLLMVGLIFLPRAASAEAPWPFCIVQDLREPSCPGEVSRRAVPSNSPAYGGYYVGGGARMAKGEGRMADEGVWGWDYVGWRFQRRVALNWWHGERYQGGSGAYKTDGPKILKKD